ncbi:hypothetical protein BIW11_03152 [Tropilaelaps mercedesae]|uniref:Uncharacterized protein n=1 Tax=Tropilaelaps mercedesae TaxID=418985 RepID=A0A1V9XRT2_9ACAR|nr:hypothetical protein BIW11_03152 [Tropilaelaps mercedesae]
MFKCRYIEIFKSSLSEMESSLNASMRPYGGGFGGRNFGGPAPRGGRPGPYDRMMGRGPPPPRPRDDGYGGVTTIMGTEADGAGVESRARPLVAAMDKVIWFICAASPTKPPRRTCTTSSRPCGRSTSTSYTRLVADPRVNAMWNSPRIATQQMPWSKTTRTWAPAT